MKDIREIEARYEHRRKTKGKINILKKRYIIVAILLIAIITNPGREEHKNKVMQLVEVALKSNIYTNTNETLHFDPFIEQMVDSYIDYSNYFFFSTTSANIQGSSKIVAFGAFGYVYIPDKLEEIITNNQF